ncbi:thioesterase family protein [Bacillaceae bacterium]
MDKWVETPVRVRYKETDQMGVVHHTNYIVWFEIGRTEWIRQAGISYNEMEKRGVLLPLTAVSADYYAPAKYDDSLIVRAKMKSLTPTRAAFAYEIRRPLDDKLLVTGETEHVWVNRDWKPVRLDKSDPELFAILQSLL